METNPAHVTGITHRRLPSWLRAQKRDTMDVVAVKRMIRKMGLHTVCQSANCPNISECFSKSTATFMILGDICTRNCRFCGVSNGIPFPVDEFEPRRIAEAVQVLGLKHAVITSVTRDDLSDGGATHFACVVAALHHSSPDLTVEVLIPDFRGNEDSLNAVLESRVDILNHNVETVPRLYPRIRPQADYIRSLCLLKQTKELRPGQVSKSGIMVGLGESEDELKKLFDELAAVSCDILTIGQYLAPDRDSYPVHDFIPPQRYAILERMAREAGIPWVYAGPFVRSSYNAESAMAKIKEFRNE